MSFTEWIGRMAEALSYQDDYIVLGELYSLHRDLIQQDLAEKQHWSDK